MGPFDERVPQRLKPQLDFNVVYGTAEAVPLSKAFETALPVLGKTESGLNDACGWVDAAEDLVGDGVGEAGVIVGGDAVSEDGGFVA